MYIDKRPKLNSSGTIPIQDTNKASFKPFQSVYFRKVDMIRTKHTHETLLEVAEQALGEVIQIDDFFYNMTMSINTGNSLSRENLKITKIDPINHGWRTLMSDSGKTFSQMKLALALCNISVIANDPIECQHFYPRHFSSQHSDFNVNLDLNENVFIDEEKEIIISPNKL